MIKLRIIESKHRTFQCDIAGCRNRTRYLIAKRQDVASHPIHLCADCIRGLNQILDEIAPYPNVVLGADPVDEVDTMDWEAALPEKEPKKEETKAEPKPNKAKKTTKKESGK